VSIEKSSLQLDLARECKIALFLIKQHSEMQDRMMQLQLKVPSMACSACAETITKAVVAVDATAKVQADPKTKLVQIETQESEATVKTAIANAGYPVD
jgi:copper chaperone